MKEAFYKTSLVCLLLIGVGQTASAYDFTVDGIYYNKLDDSSVEVTRGGNRYSGSVVIPSTVTYEEKEYAVTSIGETAFSYCTGFTSVTIQEGVASIGRRAFNRCTSLASITIPSSVTAMPDHVLECCSSLTSITISEGVTSIGYSAFVYCTGLTTITIPSSVTSIMQYAFADDMQLKTVYMKPTTPPVCGGDCFSGIAKDHVIWVSADSYKDYMISQWNIYNIKAIDETAIEGMKTVEELRIAECYDLQGRKLNAPAKGVNIIKYSDGSVRKVSVRN